MMSFSRRLQRRSVGKNGGSVASYLMPYVYNKRFLDTQYGMRKDGDIFKFGNSALVVDQDGDISIEKEFGVSVGLWEILTHERVNKEYGTSDDLRT